ncbi:SDR family oxidoreductase [Gorillibacterium timonense]|uniref:SDR family oxidoreductase n=1 Tax=Gorillibacterium timonense TaxID=1689269 RepID=UPI00071E3852|nr:SDR family oxidoreductase [Gorillibacterium timonense]
MTKYLVTGATGLLGDKAVKALLKRVPAEQVAISVRDPRKADEFAKLGVDVRQGDYDDAASLDRAFAGIERLLLISSQGDNDTRIKQHKTAVDAAKRAGVKFIAYTSAPNATHSKLFLAEVHKATEEAIQATGIPYSFLRNNWYVENETESVKGVLAGAPLITSAGAGLAGWTTRGDYAEAAAIVLSGEGHQNTIYELSGKLSTYDDYAAAISKAIGKEVSVQHVDDATYERIMTEAGLPAPIVQMLSLIQQGIRSGTLAVEGKDLAALLDRPVTSLEDAVAEVVREINASK